MLFDPSRAVWRVFLGFSMLAWLLISWPARVSSQGGGWSEPVNISNTPGTSIYPTVVADQYGFAHVFWAEAAMEGDRLSGGNPTTPNAVYYTRWDGRSWSTPTDILFVPQMPYVQFSAAEIDRLGNIHFVWQSWTFLYYSTAPALEAYRASAWSPPQEITRAFATGGAYSLDVAVDQEGTVFIAYGTIGDGGGVYVTMSEDSGASWSVPVSVMSMRDPQPGVVRIICDGRDRVHMVWGTAPRSGYSEAVYYSRSTDHGESWSSPVTIATRDEGDYKADWINVASAGQDEIHLLWLDGPYAFWNHQWSRDGGDNWSSPEAALEDVMGESGWVSLVVDGDDTLHALGQLRTRVGQVIGLYHSVWQDTRWTPAQLEGEVRTFPVATVLNGNQVVVVSNGESDGEIWVTMGRVAADYVPPLPAPTGEPPPLPTESTPLPTAAAVLGQPQEPVSTQQMARSPEGTGCWDDRPAFPIAVGAAPVLLLVTALVLANLRRRR